MKQIRQGDVFIEKIKTIPKAAKKLPLEDGRVILAHGEVTGHAHAFYGGAVMFREDGAGHGGYVALAEPAPLVHDEHSAPTLPAGKYRIVQQMQYTPQEVRRVED